jgi:WD40 repeat protein
MGGSVIAVGYTDETIRVIDLRIKSKEKAIIELKDEHTDIIKQVQLSPEGMVCLSAGSDC